MGKYKLKKWYPSLPESWKDLNIVLNIWKDKVCDGTLITRITLDEVNNTEFWQKVVDYEILSFKSNNNSIHTKRENGKFLESHISGKGFYLESGYLLPDYKIHSVKRLSDNCVFTIGDRITGKSDYDCIIHSIDLNPNYPQIMFNKLDEGIDLVNAKHIKQPLFTTEDGVNIYEGDTIFGINVLWEVFWHSTDLEHKIKHWGKLPIFSSKQKAEEYILMNKPCLSIREINLAIGEKWVSDILEKVVKNKL